MCGQNGYQAATVVLSSVTQEPYSCVQFCHDRSEPRRLESRLSCRAMKKEEERPQHHPAPQYGEWSIIDLSVRWDKRLERFASGFIGATTRNERMMERHSGSHFEQFRFWFGAARREREKAVRSRTTDRDVHSDWCAFESRCCSSASVSVPKSLYIPL